MKTYDFTYKTYENHTYKGETFFSIESPTLSKAYESLVKSLPDFPLILISPDYVVNGHRKNFPDHYLIVYTIYGDD